MFDLIFVVKTPLKYSANVAASNPGNVPTSFNRNFFASVILTPYWPNARTGTWKMIPHDKSQPFEGFHRATLPDVLIKGE